MGISKTYLEKKSKILYGFLLLANDLIFAGISCFLAYYIRFFTKLYGSAKPTYLLDKNYILYSVIFISALVIISLAFRLYFWSSIYRNTNYYLKIISTPVLSLILTLIIGRAYKAFPFSRLWIFDLLILSIFFLFFSRLLIGNITEKIFLKRGIQSDGLSFGISKARTFAPGGTGLGLPGAVGKTAPNRIISIDALRGFDMLLIMGASEFAIAVLALIKTGWASRLAEEFVHVEWNGFHFYDLVFPLFIFIVGLTVPFSLEKYRRSNRKGNGEGNNINTDFGNAYKRIISRTLILFLFGLIANGLLDFNFPEMRWLGVLQRIAICYLFAAIISLHIPKKWQPMSLGIIIAGILLGYWAILKLVPVPGGVAGDLSQQGNLAGYLDRLLLPGRFCCYSLGDNEGILSTLPALGTALLGVLAGNLLQADKPPKFKVKWVFIGGAVLLAAGVAWNFALPVNKILWTSSYVLFAGGWSLLLLGLFYFLIDYKGYKKCAFPFIVIGMNAITIYFISMIFDFGIIVNIFVHGFINYLGDGRDAFYIFCVIAIKWLFLFFLYKKKIFLKV